MAFELRGKLDTILDVQTISENFKKREFILRVDNEASGRVFTELIKFQLVGDRVNLIDNMSVNQEVNVHFNIKGRKWEKNGQTSYFTNLEAWKIDQMTAAEPVTSNESQSVSNNSAPAPAPDLDSMPFEEDLPF